MRSGAPLEVIENLQEMEDEGEIYESIEDIWPEDVYKRQSVVITGILFDSKGRQLRSIRK